MKLWPFGIRSVHVKRCSPTSLTVSTMRPWKLELAEDVRVAYDGLKLNLT